MSYKLDKTDGSLLIELVDGKIDTSSTNLTLVGKNYQGFGEFINENFIKLLENFSNSSQPNKPLRGQLWYDTAEGRLKIYDGSVFKSTDTTVYSSSRPTNLVEGNIWINGTTNQMYFYDGSNDVLVGPQYTKTQLQSGNFVETVKDSTGQNKVIIKFYINGAIVGIYAKESFTPFPTITGFTTLQSGFNISSAFNSFKFLGTASRAENLIDEFGTVYNPYDLFLRKDQAIGDATVGRITINNNDGLLIVGSSSSLELKTTGLTSIISNTNGDGDIIIRAKQGSTVYDAMYFDASEKRVGINKSNPQYTVDITGDLRITGDLLIEGDATSLDVATLRVEDHQIELAITDDSTLLSDNDVDQAGIIVRVSGDDKYLLWQNDTKKWDLSTGLNIVNEFDGYSIDDVEVINKTTLGSTVINSNLTSLGTLSTLTVDNLTLDGQRITSTDTLQISAVGTVDFLSNPQLINVGNPTDTNHVANKYYVDLQVANVTEVMGMDVTGLTSPNPLGTSNGPTVDVAIMLEEIYPAADKINGAVARVHASAISAVTEAIDVNTNVSKSFTAVDSAGVQNVSVVGDFSISSPTANVSLTVTRAIMEYEVVAGTWTWVSTTASAV
jgi:hypothetical protein